MPSWKRTDEDVSPTRYLARSLLYEALSLPLRNPGVPDLRKKHGGRYAFYWTPVRIREALAYFLIQHGRPPTNQEWRRARAYGLPNVSTLQRLGLTVKEVLEAVEEDVRKRRNDHSAS